LAEAFIDLLDAGLKKKTGTKRGMIRAALYAGFQSADKTEVQTEVQSTSFSLLLSNVSSLKAVL
jgi:hypothetical protein